MPIRVWVENRLIGHLDDGVDGGGTFAYDPETPAHCAVSITMPVRTASFSTIAGLPPIFQMNQPEGALRARLVNDFSKGGRFTDVDMLALTSVGQIGRIRYSQPGQDISSDLATESVDDLLRGGRPQEIYEYLSAKYARYSGISGVQPKTMVRDVDAPPMTFATPTHIVKFWTDEFPDLAANEFFCMAAAARAGIATPDVRLARDGSRLIIKRFDLDEDGEAIGFEDFCVLNGVGTSDKYQGGYEKRLFQRIRDYASTPAQMQDMLEKAFRMLVFTCGVRNGDAHMKNFGMIYQNPTSQVRLAPAFDIVTTTAYLPKDVMALTIDGSKQWPDARALIELGQRYARLGEQRSREIVSSVAEAIMDTRIALSQWANEDPARQTTAINMLAEWEVGVLTSLQPPSVTKKRTKPT
jgi:serine/threonine-protein kinase HipA